MGKWGLVGLLHLLLSLVVAAKLTDLAHPPEWERLDSFQKSITKYEFSKQLNEVYCPRESWWAPWIEIEENRARIRKKAGSDEWYDFYFADTKQDANLSSNLSGWDPVPRWPGSR